MTRPRAPIRKTKETVSHRQNDNVKAVGTPPVRSNFCSPLIAVLTAVQNKVTKAVSEKQLAVKEQLGSKTLIHPAVKAQLHIPSFDLSRGSEAQSCHRFSVYILE